MALCRAGKSSKSQFEKGTKYFKEVSNGVCIYYKHMGFDTGEQNLI